MSTEFHNFAKKLIHRSPEQLFFVYREGLKTAETCIRDLGGKSAALCVTFRVTKSSVKSAY